MPNHTDWFFLKKTINNYKGDIANTWGSIDEENISSICFLKCRNKNLFEFLLSNNHFSDANTIASCISLFNEQNIQLIYEKHHSKYHDILKILCTDKMILLYEEYYQKVHNENAGLTTELVQNNHQVDHKTDQDFNNIYRSIISKRYEKMIFDKQPNNTIIELINEFKFLTHPYLDDFYNFTINILSLDYVSKFTEHYKKYLELVPLIYRLINEYYLEYVKYQVKTIEDIFGNSLIIVSEYYENLKKCIHTLPKKYVDYHYQDKNGNNILFYLAKLPFLSNTINCEIYQEFLVQTTEIPLDIKNNDGNTLFHIIAINKNNLLFDKLFEQKINIINTINKVNTDIDPVINTKNKFAEIFLIENNYGKTIFDILIGNNDFDILTKIVEYMPLKAYTKITNKLIDDFEIIEKIPNIEQMNKIYLDSIDYFMDNILTLKKNILYDIDFYSENKTKILKLLSKCSNNIDFDSDCYLMWLLICIKSNDLDLFKIILSKYFYNNQNLSNTKYLNKIVQEEEPIIITAIKEQKILFVEYLLNYNIDLLVCDKLGRNVIIISLETKNIFLIKLIRNYILNIPEYYGMIPIMNNFIELIEKNETFNTFSISDTIIKLWKSIEYFTNYFIYSIHHINKQNT